MNDKGMKVRVFDMEHGLVEYEDINYAGCYNVGPDDVDCFKYSFNTINSNNCYSH